MMKSVKAFPMPEHRADFIEEIKSHVIMARMLCVEVYGVIEDVKSMPGEGHVGAFSFGQSVERCIMVFEMLKVKYQMVNAKQWQKGLGIAMPVNTKIPSTLTDQKKINQVKSKNRAARKDRLVKLARSLYPELFKKTKVTKKHGEEIVPLNKAEESGIADSLLIMEYCRRSFNNVTTESMPWEKNNK